ncbi:outer membrane efflux protein [Salinisphaera sp. PC39]
MSDNAGLDALRAAVDAAEARVVPAGSLPDPQLSGAVAPETIDGLDAPTGRDRGTNFRVEISQSFPWPGTLGLRAEAAREEAAAATENVAALRLRLAAAAKAAYAEWRYVHRALAINADNRELVDELRRVAEQRYAAGLTRQQDVLQAEVELQRLEHQAIQLKRAKRGVRAKINALLNRPATESLAEPAGLPQPQSLPPYERMRDQALSSHPELARIQRRIAANQDREAVARKEFYPDFKVFSGYNKLWDADEKRWIVGAGISLPLSRDKYRARLDEAKADTLRLEFELTDRRAQLLSQLEQAHAAAEEAQHSIALYENELVPLARENLSAARAEYGAGGGSFLAVIDAERNKLDAELNLARVRADHFAAIGDLQRWTAADLPATSTPGPMNTLEPSYE